jgi:hypothetical protein
VLLPVNYVAYQIKPHLVSSLKLQKLRLKQVHVVSVVDRARAHPAKAIRRLAQLGCIRLAAGP